MGQSADLAIWIISLTDSTERRQILTKKLTDWQCNHNVFDAVDGRSGLPAELEAQVDRSAARRAMGRDLSDGELACALSHRLVCAKFLASQAKWGLILEDDAILSDDLLTFLTGGYFKAAQMMVLFHQNARVFRQKTSLFGDYYAQRLAVSPFGAVGYTVSREAATRLVSDATPVRHTADWGTDLSRLGAVAVSPQLISHPPIDPEQSTLTIYRRKKARPRLNRFLEPAYFLRTVRKRIAVKIS